ncbi:MULTISPECIES: carbon-nitrogen hydrolase family protein [unclassified Endozoicomonas]|uniref:carbon-nitrogen hydrolase family protein n=1 Tax=unclassified Endozoicomonas TaxID=2644528 RepID=UPI002148B669|nr:MULTISPECIES: carbon-nitrogen hydrolase family protein [unclassified Endozoicomonas]
MSKAVTAAVVQMCSGPDVQANLKQAEDLLSGMESSANILVLPECFAQLGGDIPALGNNTSVVRNWMSRIARQYGAWLVGGSIPCVVNEGENSRASCFVYDPQGHEITRYDKIHLFNADVSDGTRRYRESDDYSPGNDLNVVDMEFARTGLTICYDVRFPELYRELRVRESEIITVPSAFTRVTGQAHWEPLLRARAIENHCYVLAANQGGTHPNKRETWGHSMIISPWGEVLAEADNTPCVLTTELNIKALQEIRKQMPCFEHRVL